MFDGDRYHGWAFNGAGACESIPQEKTAPSATPPSVAGAVDFPVAVSASRCAASPRACAPAFQTAVAQGMLFIYPTPKYSLGPKASPSPPPPPLPLLPEIEEPGWVYIDVQRDLPYDYATLLENVLDVSHLPFTHHASVGNRKNGAPVELELSEGGVKSGGFQGVWAEGPRRGALGTQFTAFQAPCLMRHTLTSKLFGVTLTVVYAVPSAPGRVRLLARFPFKFGSPVPAFFIKNTPVWYNHISQNAILEDDQVQSPCCI